MDELIFVPVNDAEVEILRNENDVVVNKKVEKNTNTNSGININLSNNQIAFDVKDSDVYYFYYSDNIVDNPIKFVIN